MNELLKTLKNRRSVRKYTGDPIKKADLEKILQAGLLSPSGKAKRPWEFVVVRDKNTLAQLSNARNGAAEMLKCADCAIVVIADEAKTDVWVEDCSVAMAYMHLMADSLGIGSCWIQGRMRVSLTGESSEEYVRKILAYPEGYRLEAILSLGIPEDKRPSYDLPDLPNNKVHFEKY